MAPHAFLARRPSARWAPLLGAGAILGAGAAQVVLTAWEAWPQPAISALSSRRIDLWADAWEILRTGPMMGQGPGSFADLSPTAADPDTTAAHSVLMQVLAELGVVGALLLATVAVAGLALCPRRPQPFGARRGPRGWRSGTHGLVDYVMQFPPVLLAGGLMLGSAAAAPKVTPDTRV